MKRLRQFFVFSIIIILIGLFTIFIKSFFKGKTIDEVSIDFLSTEEQRALTRYPNSYHLQVAQNQGIPKPFKSKQEMYDKKGYYIRTYHLQKIDDNKHYEVPKLTYSLPFLKTEAKSFLDELGIHFIRSLDELGVRPYRFSVTSIMRTLDDQKGLRKNNVNATPNNSSHYYGLTFDLSQTRFFERGNSKPIYSYRLRNQLLRELILMQKEGRCYVLLEHQTKCIHVTVRK